MKMNRIDQRFEQLRRQRRKAFIAFITAGYPSLGVTEKLVLEFARSGVDVIELGVPFSDPMADGPVIQEASHEALKRKTNLPAILAMVRRVRKRTDVPIALMTYYNPVFCFGEERFCDVASSSGVDGVIIPDLPPEEGKGFIRLAHRCGLDVICFIAPTTSVARIRRIAAQARGFIYYVSLTGVTGTRRRLPKDLRARIRLIKRLTDKPLCVGFGVSSHAQVKSLQQVADGVIVGSAIVAEIRRNLHATDLVRRVAEFVRKLKGKGHV